MGYKILLFFLLIGCSKVKLSEQVIISERFEVLDESTSKEQIWCEEVVKDFLEINEYDCSFKIDGIEYDIRKRVFIGMNGKLMEYWTYRSEGPVTYSMDDLKSDPKFFESTGLKDFNLNLLNNITIATSIATLEIDQIHPEYKLIVCKQNENLEKRKSKIIYKYL
jgi:hypothetical protein